jgi:hypothetical protein
LSGENLRGRLTALSSGKITVDTAGGPQTLAAADTMWLDFPPSEPLVEKPSIWIEMLDGSKLQGTSYTAAAGKAKIDLLSGLTIEVPTRSIRAVRFRQQSTPELAGQWREIAGSAATGDIVVIRKTITADAEQPGEEPSASASYSLDQLEGAVLDVTADTVQFEFDGDRHNVRREKLDGVIYFQPVKREFSPPLCRLNDIGGSTWLLRELSLAGDRLVTTSLGGAAVEWPLAAVARLDFSVGNIVFLADLEPDSGGGEPVISLQPSSMAHKFGRVFQLRPAPPLGTDAFRIGGVRFDAGLSLHSPLTLVYRVPDGFRWFRAVAGVDDSVVAPGRFDLVVRGDNQELLRHSFSSESPGGRLAVPIDLDVSSVRRLTITLDPIDGQDIGDQLNLCEARFTK